MHKSDGRVWCMSMNRKKNTQTLTYERTSSTSVLCFCIIIIFIIFIVHTTYKKNLRKTLNILCWCIVSYRMWTEHILFSDYITRHLVRRIEVTSKKRKMKLKWEKRNKEKYVRKILLCFYILAFSIYFAKCFLFLSLTLFLRSFWLFFISVFFFLGFGFSFYFVVLSVLWTRLRWDEGLKWYFKILQKFSKILRKFPKILRKILEFSQISQTNFQLTTVNVILTPNQ